jgi:HAMP domain-containing protein
VKEDVPLSCEATQLTEPLFRVKETGVYDLIFPVMAGSQKVGYVRVGLSGQRYVGKFSVIMKKSLAALFVILVVGVIFSQIIALGITRPILQLSDAAEKFSMQNWDTPLPVKGRDETEAGPGL